MAWRRRDLKGNEALRALQLKSELVPATWTYHFVERSTPSPGSLNYQIWKILDDSPIPLGPAVLGRMVGISRFCVAEHLKQMARRGQTSNLQPGRGQWVALHRGESVRTHTTTRLRPRSYGEVGEIMGCSDMTIWKRIWWLKENYPMAHEWAKPKWDSRPQRYMVNSSPSNSKSKYYEPARKVGDINIQPPGFVPPPVEEVEFSVDPARVWEGELSTARMTKVILDWGHTGTPAPPDRAGESIQGPSGSIENP